MRRIVIVTALAATLVYGHFTGYVHIAHATSLDCVVYIYSLIPSFFHPLLLSLALDLHNIAIRIIARYNPLLSHSCRGRVIAYGCLIRREGARREHLDYIYRGLMSHHQRTKLICDIFSSEVYLICSCRLVTVLV
jgi:hypothetical protein